MNRFTGIRGLMLLLLTLAMSNSLMAKVIYLNTGGSTLWEQYNAKYAVWYWGSGIEGQFSPMMQKVGENTYATNISSADYVIFVRLSDQCQTPSWDASVVWNQTADLLIDGNYYTKTGWGDAEGEWSTASVPDESVVFSETFSVSQGSFEVYDVLGSDVWQFDSRYGMKASGYQSGVSKTTLSYLISPAIRPVSGGMLTLTFEHACNFCESPASVNHVYVSTNYDGTNPLLATWEQVAIPYFPPGSNWTFVQSGEIDLTAYASVPQFHLAFCYSSTTSEAGTWEVKNIRIESVSVAMKPSYTLWIGAMANGVVNTEVNGTYDEGELVTITATADSGYRFVRWSDGSTDASRTISVDKDITLLAYFEKIQLTCAYPELAGLTGSQLLQPLNAKIKNHTVLSYSDIRADHANVDIVDGYVVDMYSSCDFTTRSYCAGLEDFPECSCYNREHALPKSWWGGSQTVPMYTDLYHLIPTDFVANTQRSAWAYGEVSSAVWGNSYGSQLGTGYTYGMGQTLFEPADEVKGDIARIYFYMLTCYLDQDFTSGKGYNMFSYSGGKAGFKANALSLLLKWHRNDPVSAREKDRAQRVEKKQGNKNPFVWEPELVEYIWGDKKNQAYPCGETPLETIEMETLLPDANAPIYNVLGQQVGENYQGIVIQNAKKYLR